MSLTAQLTNETVVAAAGEHRALLATERLVVDDKLKDRVLVVVESAHETLIDRVRYGERGERSAHGVESRARKRRETREQAWRATHDGNVGLIARIEHAQRAARRQALATRRRQRIDVLRQEGAQRADVGGARRSVAERVDAQLHACRNEMRFKLFTRSDVRF